MHGHRSNVIISLLNLRWKDYGKKKDHGDEITMDNKYESIEKLRSTVPGRSGDIPFTGLVGLPKCRTVITVRSSTNNKI